MHGRDCTISRLNTKSNTLAFRRIAGDSIPMRSIHKVEPIERFPTKPRKDGRFQKRIRGRLYYFGADGDRKSAIVEYDRVKHDLYAGRKPRVVADGDSLTLKQLANLFTAEQEARQSAGDITAGHLSDIGWAIKRFLKYLGGGRAVADIRPDDFAAYRRYLLGKVGGYAYNRERACIIAMFNHADECGWIASPIRFGKGFAKVSNSELQATRKSRMLEPPALRKLIDKSKGQLKAMILLGVNGGFGATDCSTLCRVDVDLDKRRIDTIRRKRLTIRKVPLWPETVAAVSSVMRERDDDALVFRHSSGNEWVQDKSTANINAVTKDFAELCDDLDIKRDKGASFNILRHVFSTLANETQDKDAIRRIMGHKFDGMDNAYVESIDWPRLKRVTDHVRRKLFNNLGSSPSRRSHKHRAGQS